MKIFFIFIFVSILGQSYAENPWGKDADLCYRPISTTPTPSICSTPLIGPIGETLIRFHQNVISPADGPRSHFRPSSSQYTLDAMRLHGFYRGFLMGCDRLMRENSDPWVYRTIPEGKGQSMKWDPVR